MKCGYVSLHFQESRSRTQHPRDGQVLHENKDISHGRITGFMCSGDGRITIPDGGQQKRGSQDGQASRRRPFPTEQRSQRCFERLGSRYRVDDAAGQQNDASHQQRGVHPQTSAGHAGLRAGELFLIDSCNFKFDFY